MHGHVCHIDITVKTLQYSTTVGGFHELYVSLLAQNCDVCYWLQDKLSHFKGKYTLEVVELKLELPRMVQCRLCEIHSQVQ